MVRAKIEDSRDAHRRIIHKTVLPKQTAGGASPHRPRQNRYLA
jgi:hypothetical protein